MVREEEGVCEFRNLVVTSDKKFQHWLCKAGYQPAGKLSCTLCTNAANWRYSLCCLDDMAGDQLSTVSYADHLKRYILIHN